MSKARETANITTSDQTIAGVKTFSDNVIASGSVSVNSNVNIGSALGDKLSVAVTRGYNQSADVAISVGGTDNGYVDNGRTSAWRFRVTGNALGQSLGFEGFVRGGSWTERARITSTGQLRTKVTGLDTVMDSYGCRAWMRMNDGTILDSGNVSSVTKHGTGDYTANFTTPMPDVNYAGVGMDHSLLSFSATTIITKHQSFPQTVNGMRFLSKASNTATVFNANDATMIWTR